MYQIGVHQISVHQIVQNYKLTTSERKPLVPLSELNTVRYFEADYINWNIQYHHSVPDKLWWSKQTKFPHNRRTFFTEIGRVTYEK